MKNKVVMTMGTTLLTCSGLMAASSMPTMAATNPVTISVWYSETGVYGDEIKALIKEFNQTHSDVQVQGTFVTTQVMTPQKLTAAIAAGDPPDATEINSGNVAQFASEGALVDISGFAQMTGLNASTVIPALWKKNSWNGHLYAVPHDTDVRFLFYNKDLFKAAGLNPNDPPTTIAQLDQDAAKLTKKNSKGQIVQAGFIPWQGEGWFQTWAYAFGHNYAGPNGTIRVYSNQSVKALSWEQSYAKKYGVTNLNSFTNSVPQGIDPFTAGKLAMEINGVWNIATLKQQAPKLNYGIAPLTSVSGKGFTTSGGMSFAVPKGSKHIQQGYEFIRWLANPKQQLEWDRATAHYPIITSLYKKLGTTQEIIVGLTVDQLAAKLLPTTRTSPVSPLSSELWNGAIQAVSHVTNDLSASPAEALQQLQNQLNSGN